MNTSEIKKRFRMAVAENTGCDPNDFLRPDHVYIPSDQGFKMLTFGTNLVIRGDQEMLDWIKERYNDEAAEFIMDGEMLYDIEQRLRQDGVKLQGQHMGYLYLDDTMNIPAPTGYEYRLFQRSQLKSLYEYKMFDNAFAFDDTKDVIALGALYQGEFVAMAGADDGLKDFWQLGIDTIPEHRGKGLGVYLVHALVKEITRLGKMCYYNTWGSNIASMNVAAKTGFKPVMTYYYGEKVEG